jgi:hypothetical protein
MVAAPSMLSPLSEFQSQELGVPTRTTAVTPVVRRSSTCVAADGEDAIDAAFETMIAYASSSVAISEQQGGKKGINGPPPQPTLPAARHAILELIARLPP